MSVSTSIDGNEGLYVPFRGFDRGAGAVGTLDIQGKTTGDGSGGTVAINIQMQRIMFGFHLIWVPTLVSIFDTLATAVDVELLLRGLGQERILDFHAEIVTMTASTFTVRNLGRAVNLALPIEPQSDTLGTVLSAGWATNTNALLYELHVFGAVYDAEALAKGKAEGKAADVLLAGVR